MGERELLRRGGSTTKASPRCASSSKPWVVAAILSSPLKDSAARVVALVVEVATATAVSPSTPTSVALRRKAAARGFGAAPSRRRWREAGAR